MQHSTRPPRGAGRPPRADPFPAPAEKRPPHVAVIVVTWNRLASVRRLLSDLVAQDAHAAAQIILVDNASDDDTAQIIHDEHPASLSVENRSASATRPAFTRPIAHLFAKPDPGTPPLTLVRNRRNLGGCGGFNTGLAYVRQLETPPDFVWMVDDDARLPTDALRRLLAPAFADPSIGLVGSRTVDINDRETTIETTIYFDRHTGFMRDRPPQGHPMHAHHEAWSRQAPTGGRDTGVIEVDVASACSLLSRWSAADRVGPWDDAFFLYCDDADWCLRFQRAGHRVVCALDARVFHAPWHTKLTPTREYYAKRNAMWMHRHALEGPALRRLAWRWPLWLAKEALRQWRAGRRLSAWMTARALFDAAMQRGGPVNDTEEGSPPSVVSFALLLAVSVLLSIVQAPFARGRRVPTWAPRPERRPLPRPVLAPVHPQSGPPTQTPEPRGDAR